jgi:hypothetical protein
LLCFESGNCGKGGRIRKGIRGEKEKPLKAFESSKMQAVCRI